MLHSNSLIKLPQIFMQKGGFKLKGCIQAQLLKRIPEYKVNHQTM